MTVVLKDVTRVVGAVAHISEVSLTLEPGTLSVLLGPTLSGKTSLMRLLAGLDVPTAGRVVVNGKDVTGIDVRKRSVAMVYQQFVNYPSLTVFENIASPLRVQGRPNEEVERRVQEVAALLRLQPYLERPPLALSGGQQQRTAIARALVKGADLVLLDEPLANLDYKLREELRTELPRIFAGVRRHLCLRHDRAFRSTAAGRPYHLHVRGPRPAGRRHAERLPPARQYRGWRELFSDPPLNTVADREEGRVGGLWRRRHGTRQRPLRRAGRRTAIASASAPTSSPSPDGTAAGHHVFPATVALTEITGSESFVHLKRDGTTLGRRPARRP